MCLDSTEELAADGRAELNGIDPVSNEDFHNGVPLRMENHNEYLSILN